MTLRDATHALRALGFTLRKRDGEYRVAPSGTGNEDVAYYTNDLDDAITTGQDMARRFKGSRFTK